MLEKGLPWKKVCAAEEGILWRGLKPTRAIPWFMPLGAFPSGGEAIEFTFREQLLLRHQQVRPLTRFE